MWKRNWTDTGWALGIEPGPMSRETDFISIQGTVLRLSCMGWGWYRGGKSF